MGVVRSGAKGVSVGVQPGVRAGDFGAGFPSSSGEAAGFWEVNCSDSVEPSMASVLVSPPERTWATSSK